MTTKVYKTARGKTVDIGSLRLQNENVRAVGNMGVNARGDRIDSQGNVIDPINKQIQRRIQKQTNVSSGPVQSSSKATQKPVDIPEVEDDPLGPLDAVDNTVVEPETVDTGDAVDTTDSTDTAEPAPTSTKKVVTTDSSTGLAAAIARSKTIKQELEKSPKSQPQSLRKI